MCRKILVKVLAINESQNHFITLSNANLQHSENYIIILLAKIMIAQFYINECIKMFIIVTK